MEIKRACCFALVSEHGQIERVNRPKMAQKKGAGTMPTPS
jgi:hypothetical protein